MKKIENVLMCGLGAVGMTFACKIFNKRPETLKVLVDNERFERYSSTPREMNGEKYFFDYILPSEKDYKADLVIIATKIDGLDSVVENLKNFVGEDTVILPILNGVTAEKRVAQTFGAEKLLYGYFIGHSAMRVNNQIVQDGVGKIVFGSDKENDEYNVQRVREYFASVNIDYDTPENIVYSKWVKFALNLVCNQPSCILKMTFGDIQNNKNYIQFAKNIMQEVKEIAVCEGVKGIDSLEKDVIDAIYTMVANGKTSMLQDVESKKKTELDIFAGTIIELGKKYSIPTPYNQVLFEMIKIIEENYTVQEMKG